MNNVAKFRWRYPRDRQDAASSSDPHVITSVTDSGGAAVFHTQAAHGLAPTAAVDLHMDIQYGDIIGAIVDTVPDSTSFTLVLVAFNGDSTGTWELGIG